MCGACCPGPGTLPPANMPLDVMHLVRDPQIQWPDASGWGPEGMGARPRVMLCICWGNICAMHTLLAEAVPFVNREACPV